MKEEKIRFVCNKCGKDMPIDKKKSNKNWTVYKTSCPCGGEMALRVEVKGYKIK